MVKLSYRITASLADENRAAFELLASCGLLAPDALRVDASDYKQPFKLLEALRNVGYVADLETIKNA